MYKRAFAFICCSLRDLLGLDASRASSFYPHSPEGDGNNIRISSQLYDVNIFSSSYLSSIFSNNYLSSRFDIHLPGSCWSWHIKVIRLHLTFTIWNLSCSFWTHHTYVFIFLFSSHLCNILILNDIYKLQFSKSYVLTVICYLSFLGSG